MLGAPEVGTLWVIRHMTAAYFNSLGGVPQGFVMSLENDLPLWTISGRPIREGVDYHWSGRHVVYSSDVVYFSTDDSVGAGWYVLASGYSLTVP